MVGDLDLAARYTAILHEQTKTHSLDVWNAYADGFAGEIVIRRGNVAVGLDALRAAIETLGRAGFVLYQTSFLASLAQGLIMSRQVGEALAAVDRAIATCDRTSEAWLLAELHRIRGEAQLLEKEAGAHENGETSLLLSLEIARSQGARAWELRTSTSLAKVWRQTSRSLAARDLLSEVLAKTTEGFATPDHIAATSMLAGIERITA
jgi:predicted ATPase